MKLYRGGFLKIIWTKLINLRIFFFQKKKSWKKKRKIGDFLFEISMKKEEFFLFFFFIKKRKKIYYKFFVDDGFYYCFSHISFSVFMDSGFWISILLSFGKGFSELF